MTTQTSVVLSLVAIQLFIAASILAIPYVTHRDLLFGVPVPPGFRSTSTGRKALSLFRLCVILPALAGLAGTLVLRASPFSIFGFLLSPVVGLTAFLALNRRLKPFAIQPPLVREAVLDSGQPLPWFIWLGIIPLLLLAGAALYLQTHWNQIPLRFPVHFDINGNPNRWADRSIRGVYGVLIFGGEFALALFGLAFAGWYGSRKSDAMRKPAVAVMLMTELIIALLFSLIPLQTAAGFRIPIPVMILLPLAMLIPVLAYWAREANKPRDPIDPTPNECWKGGMLYDNPDDAALFVQRRDSLGFTVNFGNRWSWAILAGLLLLIASGPLIMKILPQ